MTNTLKNQYILSINAIKPLDEKEQNDIQEVKSWIHQSESLWKPENMEKHFGAIGIILSKDKTKTFLINHRKAGIWLPPGGHVENRQTFKETIAMELREEVGINEPVYINSDIFFLTQTRVQEAGREHIDITVWYLLEGDESVNYPVLEDEATEGKWFLIQTILEDMSFSFLHRSFKKLSEMLA